MSSSQQNDGEPKNPTKNGENKSYKYCEIAKPDKIEFYKNCFPSEKNVNHLYVNIEGPEFSQDYSYFIVDMSQDIMDLERGIPLLQDNSL